MNKVKKRKKIKKNKNYFVHFMKLFLGVFFAIIIIGTILLLSVYLVKGMRHTETEEVAEAIVPVEKFPEISEEMEEEEEIPQGKYGVLLKDSEAMREQNIFAKEAREEGEISLLFAGDILFDANYAVMSNLLRSGGGIENAFSQNILEEMHTADIFMVNNEFPYSDRGEPIADKAFTFRAKPETADYLLQMGVDLVSLANNHAYDYGDIALKDTLEILTQAEVAFAGAGNNIEEAARPIYFILNDTKIAFICATQIERLDNPDTKEATENSAGVFRCWNPERLYAVIEQADKQSDFVIVYVHWGTENEKEIDWAQKDHAPKYVEAGADLIIGDHPHCLQKIEYIQKVPVIYSLGNFWFNSKTVDTAMVKVTLSKEGKMEYRFLPCKQEGSKTTLLEGEEKQRVINEMNAMSSTAYIDEEGITTAKEK